MPLWNDILANSALWSLESPSWPSAFSLGGEGAVFRGPGPLPLPSYPQLQYMMVMVGYPDFLLKPEAVDKEYEVAPVWPGPVEVRPQTQRESQLFG